MHECIQYIWSPQNINLCLGQEIRVDDFFLQGRKVIQSPQVQQGPLCTLTSMLNFVLVWPLLQQGCTIYFHDGPSILVVYVGQTTLLCVPASRQDMHMAGGTWLRTILSQDFWVWVKEADLSCTYRGSGKWAEKHTLVFLPSIRSSPHLPKCYNF